MTLLALQVYRLATAEGGRYATALNAGTRTFNSRVSATRPVRLRLFPSPLPQRGSDNADSNPTAGGCHE